MAQRRTERVGNADRWSPGNDRRRRSAAAPERISAAAQESHHPNRGDDSSVGDDVPDGTIGPDHRRGRRHGALATRRTSAVGPSHGDGRRCRNDRAARSRVARGHGCWPPAVTPQSLNGGAVAERQRVADHPFNQCRVRSRRTRVSSSIWLSRNLTMSPMLTMPQRRPSSTTGMWRRRRRVIVSMTCCTASSGEHVSGRLSIRSRTFRPAIDPSPSATANMMLRSPTRPSTWSPSVTTSAAIPYVRIRDAANAASASRPMVCTSLPLSAKIARIVVVMTAPFEKACAATTIVYPASTSTRWAQIRSSDVSITALDDAGG